MINFDEKALEIYEQNKAIGWWDDPDRCIYQTLQLVSTEIAEATEGERKDLMDDHLPHRKMGEVELADALIRLLDMAGAYGWTAVRVYDDNLTSKFTDPDFTISGKHLFLNVMISRLALSIEHKSESSSLADLSYSRLAIAIVTVSETHGYDIESAMNEKLAYNKNRADHKRENRAKEGGKKF